MASPQPSEEMAPRIFPNEALELLRGGEVTVVDVRPPEAYAAGHIPGALSIPLADLRPRLARIPRDRAVIFYCT